MEKNIIKTIMVNDTIRKPSVVHEDNFALLAGHLLIVFYCLIFILGFLGNSAVIFVAIRKKKYRNVTNCYVINLALADLLFLTLSIPYTTYMGLVDNYPFGDTICKIYIYLTYVFLLAICETLAAMSIDRYFYIVSPKSRLLWRTPYTAFIVCIIIWANSLAAIIPYHIISHIAASNIITCGGNDRKKFSVCFLIFCSYYAIPLIIIIVCYTKLAMHVIQSNRLIASHMNTKNVLKLLKTKQRKVTRMVIVVTLVFAICWLPIHILELLTCADSSILNTLLESSPKVLYTIRAFAHALAYLNSCLNPYLYALLNHNFCFDLIDIIPSYLKCCKHSETFQSKITYTKSKIISTTLIQNESLLNKRPDNDDDEEIANQTNIDIQM